MATTNNIFYLGQDGAEQLVTNVKNLIGDYALKDETEASLGETVKFTAQNLTDEQKAQARENIGITDDGSGGVTSWNDLSDKPFYMESNDIILLDGDFTTEYISAYNVFGIDTAYIETQEAAPEMVTLVYDGVEYKGLTFTDIPDLGKVGGNLYHMNALFGTSFEDTGEPFILAVTKTGCAIMTLDTEATAHAIRLFIAVESVEKINISCLPEGYPYVETAIVNHPFDGDITAKEHVMLSEGIYAVRVSTEYVSVSDAIGSKLIVHSEADGADGGDVELNVTEDFAVDATSMLGVSGTLIGFSDNTISALSLPDDTSIEGITLCAGTWFMCVPGMMYTKSLSCLTDGNGEVEIVHRLDEKYLPASVLTQEKYDELRTHWTDTDGTVHQLDEKYIPAEWLANEVFQENVSILGETTITTESDYPNGKRHTIDIGCKLLLNRPEKMTVIYDGVVYKGEVAYFSNRFIWGDGSLYNFNPEYVSHSGEPFLMWHLKDSNELTVFTTSAGEHTFELYIDAVLPVLIPEKYLPESVALKSDLENIPNKMDSNNPVGTGSFSMNRKEGTTVGTKSHAEGSDTTASGYASHAEGNDTTASGMYSHAEGKDTMASAMHSHAEGYGTKASNLDSHAEGCDSKASGYASHAEGQATIASGHYSHAEGLLTIASGENSHVQGKYNIEDAENKYAHIVGNGEEGSYRSNAHTLDWDGNAWYQGDVYVGSTSGVNRDEGSKKLATEEYINIRVPAWTDADEGKFLRIVNGTPTWVHIPSAEEASF